MVSLLDGALQLLLSLGLHFRYALDSFRIFHDSILSSGVFKFRELLSLNHTGLFKSQNCQFVGEVISFFLIIKASRVQKGLDDFLVFTFKVLLSSVYLQKVESQCPEDLFPFDLTIRIINGLHILDEAYYSNLFSCNKIWTQAIDIFLFRSLRCHLYHAYTSSMTR